MGLVTDVLAHVLLPQTCAHCKEDLRFREASPLCRPCAKTLKPCEDAISTRSCGPVRAAFLYGGAAASLVHAFKYRGRRAAAEVAGLWMAAALPRFPELKGYDALVPVPLHRRRRRERGYNQAEDLALSLGSAGAVPVLGLVERVRDTPPQWDLSPRERRLNLRAAFAAAPAAAGKRLLLVDDVCTSGTSLEECAKALRQAGARAVGAYVLARQLR